MEKIKETDLWFENNLDFGDNFSVFYIGKVNKKIEMIKYKYLNKQFSS